MRAAVVAVAWAALVLAGAGRWRPHPARVGALTPARPWPAVTDARLRRLLPAAIAAAIGVAVLPPAAPVLALGAWWLPVRRQRRHRRAAAEVVRRSLPEVVDLFALAVGAGLTVPLAVAAVARRHDGPVGVALGDVVAAIDRGRRCADALDAAAAALGPDARPLLGALASSERYGAPLGDALARLAADARADRRRRAEEAARRVPVQLLFPLVLCVLPAFGLLTLAPLLAGALGSLRL